MTVKQKQLDGGSWAAFKKAISANCLFYVDGFCDSFAVNYTCGGVTVENVAEAPTPHYWTFANVEDLISNFTVDGKALADIWQHVGFIKCPR